MKARSPAPAPVILLHCSGSSGSQWDGLAGRLASRFEVFAPHYQDRPGIESRHRGLQEDAASVRRLVGAHSQPAHLVGHSYGGAVALRLACDTPGHFRTLTLVEPTAFQLLHLGGDRDRAALDEVDAVARQIAEAHAAGHVMAGFGRFVDYWNGPGTWEAMPASRRERLAPLLGRIVGDFKALFEDSPSVEQLRRLTLPTLLIQGGKTRLPAERVCARLRVAIAHAEFALLENAGHMLPVTHRDAVNVLVERHLRANEPPRRLFAPRGEGVQAVSATP